MLKKHIHFSIVAALRNKMGIYFVEEYIFTFIIESSFYLKFDTKQLFKLSYSNASWYTHRFEKLLVNCSS